jgi:2-methylcitrate dehydratase PrpD
LESTIKKYNSMIHTQSPVHCMVELVRQSKLDPDKVVSIEADVTRITYDFAGGGLYGVDKVVQTKEQADHNLPFAVALLDGDVMPSRTHRARRCAAAPQEGFGPAGSGVYRPISRKDAHQDCRPATMRI